MAKGIKMGMSSTGGVQMPSIIVAGETILYWVYACIGDAYDSTTFTDVGFGCAFKALSAGTYRVRYAMRADYEDAYGRLTKNGSVIPGSSITADYYWASDLIYTDVACSVNDIVRLQWKTDSDGYGVVDFFMVSILATDIQAEFNKLVIAA